MSRGGSAPKARASVLDAGLSPRSRTPSRPTRATRLMSALPESRGSRASTTSPGRAIARATRRRSPGSRVGAMERPRTSTVSRRRLARIKTPASATPSASAARTVRRSGRPPVDARLLGTAGGLPHLVDRVDHQEQLLRRADIKRLLHLRGLLRGLPERLVDARMLLEVLRLEVVAPEDVEMMLHELRALLLDVDAASAEQRIVAGLVLLDDAEARLGLDAGLLGIIDAARDVAVGVDHARWAQDGAQGKHRSPFR